MKYGVLEGTKEGMKEEEELKNEEVDGGKAGVRSMEVFTSFTRNPQASAGRA